MPRSTIAVETPAQRADDASLSHGLKQRHLSMIALGGVIGAGLFVGSGAGIAAAGPSIIVAYSLSGILVMLVMRMLGELSAAYPSSGSFSTHAERALGPWAGFTVGWAYWVLLCTAVGLEGIGAATIVTGWLPGTPQWMWVALFMVLFCGTNLAAVKNFGEFEFWFAALKVAAIVLFLVLGVLAIAGVLPGTDAPGTSHLSDFLPHGGHGLIVGLLASVFAYGGLETVTIAAAESEDPVRGVAGAVRTAMWRIALFYIGSMAVVVTLVPWDDPEVVDKGPYVATLDHLGIPAAGQLMNVVVLVALLSAMNANIYGSSRIAYSLVRRGQGPKALARVAGGVPRAAVLTSSAFGFVCVLLSYWRPDDVFPWLLNMIGAVVLVVWIFIALSQLMLRTRLEREEPQKLVVRMWGFPWLTCLAMAGMVAIFWLMAQEPDTRVQLYSTGAMTLVLAAAGCLWQRTRARTRT
ncbi:MULTISPECIES: amino acid permease [Streptomyces]|uniref:Amino acid permease n=1 Tax=Streptomyces thermoviolaceus subsp. thermoviolaceus TaxID=66860 RepID=A0ABX0Z057_STRTL|nr:amino acid permease [Streptomyces thermoviolaceus]MCM3266092.1 amino acid permease [Streptomyces thermoviolaceus]NJP16673.1 amino acid permease [Streptomyces thermoviolaceus subsp. thermoviolaceus]WTD49220.1 amino acid permease [Streptomyces thermoviolaceus]GGV80208.1 amino acid transporter [Streptomyces thermoviolaceus subsp. apingens]GHB10411.1 amino acid transporter [Streptomyces thermoviolaceus subsp. thermoviolaceus]